MILENVFDGNCSTIEIFTTIGTPLIDEEGMVYADIDLEKCIQPKQMHDILGHYNRFDIFDLRVNTAPTRKITFIDNYEEFNKR